MELNIAKSYIEDRDIAPFTERHLREYMASKAELKHLLAG